MKRDQLRNLGVEFRKAVLRADPELGEYHRLGAALLEMVQSGKLDELIGDKDA